MHDCTVYDRPELFETLVPPRPSWHDVYSQFARVLSKRSTCRRLQVGCVVVSGDNQRILAIGYNGNWKGGPNDCDSDVEGSCGCTHGEANCMVKFDPREASGAVLFTTDGPCVACAKLIINAGIKNVVYGEEYRIRAGVELLSRAGVRVTRYQTS